MRHAAVTWLSSDDLVTNVTLRLLGSAESEPEYHEGSYKDTHVHL